MSTLQQSDNKLITQQFLEDSKNDVSVVDHIQDESNKLSLENISKEKPPETDATLKSKHDLSDETESSRDSNSVERDVAEEDEQVESKPKEEEWQDILGSGVIMKKVLKDGEPDSRPTKSDKCIVNYTCRLEEADEEDFAVKEENFELNLGEGDVIQGLDVAIALMNRKERCLLKIGSRLAFGDKGLSPKIPGSASVVFDVELIDTKPEEDVEAMSIQERQKMGNQKRERGNWWYQRGENTLAVQCYRRALNFLDEVENENDQYKPTDSELQHLLEDRLKVLNNMASAQIKMELYDQALLSLQTVLRCQPNNVKALFRKAKIHTAKNDLPQALKLLEKVRSLEPDDPLITKEIGIVTSLINKQKNSEREYARRMFGGTSPLESSSSKTKVKKNEKTKSGSRVQVWATLGATAIIGLAGIVAYKLKYF